MKAKELYEWLGEHTSPDMDIIIEVGGDGAIHSSDINSIWTNMKDNVVTISSER